MTIKLLSLDFGRSKQESDLIISLCEFEGIGFDRVTSANKELFKKYSKGNGPIILIDSDVPDRPHILYGFWAFAQYLLNQGLIRC